jgi:hypothetical protein
MSVIQSYFFRFLAIDNDIMQKMCTLITSKGTDINENIANQNHATRTRTPKPGYLKLTNVTKDPHSTYRGNFCRLEGGGGGRQISF